MKKGNYFLTLVAAVTDVPSYTIDCVPATDSVPTFAGILSVVGIHAVHTLSGFLTFAYFLMRLLLANAYKSRGQAVLG